MLLNYGGFDIRGTHYGDIFDPNSKSTIFGTASSSGFPYDSQGDLCKDSRGIRVTTFTSQQDGSEKPLLAIEYHVGGGVSCRLHGQCHAYREPRFHLYLHHWTGHELVSKHASLPGPTGKRPGVSDLHSRPAGGEVFLCTELSVAGLHR